MTPRCDHMYKSSDFEKPAYDFKENKSRSRERRSRINRLSKDGNIPPDTRVSAEEVMWQINVQPSPVPQAPKVFSYQKNCQLHRVEQIHAQKVQDFRYKVAAKKIQRVIRAYLFYKRVRGQRKEQSAERRRKG